MKKISDDLAPLLALCRQGTQSGGMTAYRFTSWLTLSVALIATALSGAGCGNSVLDESPEAEDTSGDGDGNGDDANGDGDDANGNGDDGTSTASDECIPYEDDCAEGLYCQFVDGRTQCIPEGAVARDETCEEDLCERGSICMFADSLYGKQCQQPCNLAEDLPCDIGRHTCFVAVDDDGQELEFGVCRY